MSPQEPALGPAAPAPTPVDQTTRPHGLYAVYAGLAALTFLNAIAIWAFHKDVSNAVAAIGAISSPIVAMVSAYFGIKVGSQTGAANAATANDARTQADNQVKALLGRLAPADALPMMESLGIVTVPPAAGARPADGGSQG